MARIAKLAPAAKAVKQLQITRSKRHTMVDARKAVADKLLANVAHLRDPEGNERPDLVYKDQGRGLYSAGIKYGNRWLAGVFAGNTYLQGLSGTELCDLLEGFAQDALEGQFDAYIQPIMDANIAARAGAND